MYFSGLAQPDGVARMADADGMKLVFRLGTIGFVLPVRDLIEIAEVPVEQVEACPADGASCMDGWLLRRGERVPLFSLARRLDLPIPDGGGAVVAVVMVGADGPWSIRVERIEGIFPGAEFVLVPAAAWMFQRERWPFVNLALWRAQPLIHCASMALEARWGDA